MVEAVTQEPQPFKIRWHHLWLYATLLEYSSWHGIENAAGLYGDKLVDETGSFYDSLREGGAKKKAWYRNDVLGPREESMEIHRINIQKLLKRF
jgi:hypothetical protein